MPNPNPNPKPNEWHMHAVTWFPVSRCARASTRLWPWTMPQSRYFCVMHFTLIRFSSGLCLYLGNDNRPNDKALCNGWMLIYDWKHMVFFSCLSVVGAANFSIDRIWNGMKGNVDEWCLLMSRVDCQRSAEFKWNRLFGLGPSMRLYVSLSLL